MAKVNIEAVRFQVATAKGYAEKAMKDAAEERAQQVFTEAVITLQEDFEQHPVTQEIAGGISSPNISNTLNGGGAPVSLYSFIGFPQGAQPLDPIRDQMNPENKGGPAIRYVRKEVKQNAQFTFEVKAPDLEVIYKKTPMPWAKGWSWARQIETYIPGFAHFLGKFMPNASDKVSRSKGGTQIKSAEIRPGAEFTPPEGGYLTGLFEKFLATVREYQKKGLRNRRFK